MTECAFVPDSRVEPAAGTLPPPSVAHAVSPLKVFLRRLACLVLAMELSLPCPVLAAPESPSLPDAESEVYASVLSFATQNSPADKVFVILDTTIRLKDFAGNGNNPATRIHEALPSATERVVANFLASTNTHARISYKSIRSKSNTRFAIMSQATEANLFRDRSLRKGWSNFQLRYPKSPIGYIQFSRVGYDPIIDQALVFVRFYCGPSNACGAGYLILLQKQLGIWNKAGSYLWFIS